MFCTASKIRSGRANTYPNPHENKRSARFSRRSRDRLTPPRTRAWSGRAAPRRSASARPSRDFSSSASFALGGRSDGAFEGNGVSRRRDARTASRRSTSVVGARAATTAVVCFGAARAPSTSWPARSTSRRTATPWSTTSTHQREWSPACCTRGRLSKHSCFISSRRSAACALSEQPPLLARRAARRSRSFARGGGICPCAPMH